tara:strand:+ start:255 stop:398 length:144 start_codon:yes stop_codon:yes gene_type:complete
VKLKLVKAEFLDHLVMVMMEGMVLVVLGMIRLAEAEVVLVVLVVMVL